MENIQMLPLSPPSCRVLCMAVMTLRDIRPTQAEFIAYVKNKKL